MSKDGKDFDLNMHIFRLLMNEPFFAALSLQINKVKTTTIPTAGVCVNPKTQQFELAYNPEFMASLTDVQKLGVLKHEFYHLIFEHVTGRKPADPKMFKVWNVAADLAINSHLVGELPDNCCMPGIGPFKNYKSGQTAEAYFNTLKQELKKNQNEQEMMEGQFDNHDGWSATSTNDISKEGNADGGGDSISSAAKERLKNILKKAVQQSQGRGAGWGSVPAVCQKEIIDRLQHKIDWRKVMRYFIKTSQRASKFSSPRRVNKRYQYIHPGKRSRRTANIAIAIDQSGSVSDQLLSLFFAELNALANIATFTVIPHDSHVDESKIFVWEKGKRMTAERVLCGGTDFNPPTEYINKHNFDGAIFLTDLMAPKPIPCKCQRMWMSDVENASRPYFQTTERIIAIDK